ncbi:MAG: MarC family NAAT transporter [Roseivirga sp.]
MKMEVFLGIFSALFSVVNPLGAMPVFVGLTEGAQSREIRSQAMKVGVFVVVILLVFFFSGNLILQFFGIQLEHIRIAGGLLISISAMSLVGKEAYKGKFIAPEVQEESMQREDISFTPMAMPMLAGPGAIALMISMNDRVEFHSAFGSVTMILAVVAVALITTLILMFSNKLNKFIGKAGMSALSRMMGFIVLSIGISMIFNGLVPLIK